MSSQVEPPRRAARVTHLNHNEDEIREAEELIARALRDPSEVAEAPPARRRRRRKLGKKRRFRGADGEPLPTYLVEDFPSCEYVR